MFDVANTKGRLCKQNSSAAISSPKLQELQAMLVIKIAEKGSSMHRAITKVLKQFDSNNNGELEMPELERAMKVFLPGITDAETAALAGAFDAYGSGSVSIEEIAAGARKLELEGQANCSWGMEAPSYAASSKPTSRASSRASCTSTAYSSITGPSRASSSTGGGPMSDAGTAFSAHTDSSIACSRATQALLSESPTALRACDRPSKAHSSKAKSPGGSVAAASSLACRSAGRAPMSASSLGMSCGDQSVASHASEVKMSFSDRLKRFQVGIRNAVARHTKKQSRKKAGAGAEDRLAMRSTEHTEKLSREYMTAVFKAHGLAEGRKYKLSLSKFKSALQTLHELQPGQCFLSSSDVARLHEMCSGGDYRPFIESLYLKEARKPNKFGFQQVDTTATELPNPVLGDGPFDKGHKGVRDIEELPTPAEIPQRLRYRHCKTHVAPPSAFQPALIARSARLPNAHLELEHVFGYRPGRGGSNLCAVGDSSVVYTVAAVAVVNEAASGVQRFFLGHTDDISALGTSTDGSMAATGQVGKRPFLLIWNVKSTETIAKIGQGFFERLVCCTAFSKDGLFVAAVAGDNHHMMGVWEVATGGLVADAPCQNGVPPQVHSVAWAPFTTDVNGAAVSTLVTTGPSRHLKFWTLDQALAKQKTKGRVGTEGRAALKGKPAVFGSKHDMPRELFCCLFLQRGHLALTGGNNGMVMVWELPRGKCLASIAAHTGPVYSLALGPTSDPNEFFSAGADGAVKLWSSTGGKAAFHKALSLQLPLPPAQESASRTGTPGGLTGHTAAKPTLFVKQPHEKRGKSRGSSSSSSGSDWKAAALLTKDKGRAARGSSSKLKQGGPLPAGASAGAGDGSASKSVASPPAVAALDVAMTFDRRLAVGTAKGEVYVTDPMATPPHPVTPPRLTRLTTGHSRSVAGLAPHPKLPGVYATAGEDKLLAIWDARERSLVRHTHLPVPGRSVAFSPDGKLIAVGMMKGALAVLDAAKLRVLKVMRHCAEDLADVKFSPDGSKLAVGSHDNYIDVYDIKDKVIKRRGRCIGHTSYITHIDWSKDSRLLQSNCGAYEILYWDASTCKQLRSSTDDVESNTLWSTYTCVLGFPVMGIWPPFSDGTDVNALQRSRDGRFLVTADDFGGIKIFNSPCIVDNAPHRRYKGHSAHVMNVRFTTNQEHVISVGGGDKAILQWKIHNRAPSAEDFSKPKATKWTTKAAWI